MSSAQKSGESQVKSHGKCNGNWLRLGVCTENYKWCGPRVLTYLWYMIPQMDLKMMLVSIEAPEVSSLIESDASAVRVYSSKLLDGCCPVECTYHTCIS